MSVLGERSQNLTFAQKLANTNWMLIVLIFATAGIGLAMLYSVANGNVNPWMSRQLVRFAIGLAVMFTVAFIDIRVWMRLAYPIYGVALSLLVSCRRWVRSAWARSAGSASGFSTCSPPNS